MRIAEVSRETKETKIFVRINLDGSGVAEVETTIPFLDHLLKTISVHSLIDVKVRAEGDLKHHIIEDVAICLGKAINKALGERKNIKRFGYAVIPMDDSLAFSAIDLVRRPYAKIDFGFKGFVEGVLADDLRHFIEVLAYYMQATIHIRVEYGINPHHMIESAFKALAISLRQALSAEEKRETLSAKGVM